MSRTLISNCRTDIKIVLVGNSGTGKTSFCSRWTKDAFTETYKATIMSEFSYKIYEYKGQYYKIQIWDIAGQDKNIYTSKIFTKDAHGCLILSDITNAETLDATLKWKKAIDENANFIDGGKLPCLLIQNKIDLVDEEEKQDEEEVRAFAQKNNYINVFRTSVKEGIGVDESMDYLIKVIVDRLDEYVSKTNKPIERDKTSLVIQQSKKDTTSLLAKKSCCSW
jgi:small GTP-binding protein